jgi:hypothetical protein
MPSTDNGAGAVGLSADARALPQRILGLSPAPTQQQPAPLPAPRGAAPTVITAADGHIETIIRIIPRGSFNRLVISDVVAPNGKTYASIRNWISQDGAEWKPTHKGCMIRIGLELDDAIDALAAARDMGGMSR